MDRIEKILVFVVVATIVIIVTIALSTSRGGDADDTAGSVSAPGAGVPGGHFSSGGTVTDGDRAIEGSRLAASGTRSRDGEGAFGTDEALSPEVIDLRRAARSGSVPGPSSGNGAQGRGSLAASRQPDPRDGSGNLGSPSSPASNSFAKNERDATVGGGGSAKGPGAKPAPDGGNSSSIADEVPIVADPKFVTVQKNDSYWKISERLYGNGKHWKVLVDANKDVPPESMRPGIKILVPEFEPAAVAKIKPTLAVNAKGAKSERSTDGKHRVVKLEKGDYLYKVLRKLKMTKRYREVLTLNGLTAAEASNLQPGHRLKIPN